MSLEYRMKPDVDPSFYHDPPCPHCNDNPNGCFVSITGPLDYPTVTYERCWWCGNGAQNTYVTKKPETSGESTK
jgi:hypothetical protein